mgnify:CR=1 FL=1
MRRFDDLFRAVKFFPSVNIYMLAILMFLSLGVQAEANKQSEEFEGISVTGSNEQPQVLYIIPWQPPAYQKRAQHPPNMKLSGIIKPIEPVFHNEDYHFRKKLQVKVQALNGRK